MATKVAKKLYDVYWAPEGKRIATVLAATPSAAIKQAPLPYRKFLGEMYAEAHTPTLPSKDI